MIKNVYSTNSSAKNFSRHELLEWINDCLGTKLYDVENMCTGAAYCQLLNNLFPGSVSLRRIKFDAHLEYEYINNFKVLQAAFEKLHVRKSIPIERLVKGRFQDNFEFLIWFKKFYDVNGGVVDHKPATEAEKDDEEPSTYTRKKRKGVLLSEIPRSRFGGFGSSTRKDTADAQSSSQGFLQRPTDRDYLIQQIKALKSENLSMDSTLKKVMEEREDFTQKIRRIVYLCERDGESGNRSPLATKILQTVSGQMESSVPSSTTSIGEFNENEEANSFEYNNEACEEEQTEPTLNEAD